MDILNQVRSPIRASETKTKTKKYRANRENVEKIEKNQNNENKASDSRREKLKRSPKTINLGETPQEVEYNMKSINRPKKNIN